MLRTADGVVAAAEVAKTGTADARECTEHGPISRWGFGTAYTCRAEVRWDDGTVEQREFVTGQLRPGDNAVPVFLTKGSRTSKAEAGRNDSARWIIVGTVGGYGLFALALLLAFNTLLRLWLLIRPSSARTTGEKPRSGRSRRRRSPRRQYRAGCGGCACTPGSGWRRARWTCSRRFPGSTHHVRSARSSRHGPIWVRPG